MKHDAVVSNVILFPLGEIRMGCDAYGLSIKTNFGDFDIFKDTPILIGNKDYSKCIEQSECTRYLLLRGEFGIYILDIKDQSVSAYKVTVRGSSNEWSEEQAIYGKVKSHIKGFARHYYLQFPFVRQNKFLQTVADYDALRRRQIKESLNAYTG